VKDPELAPTLHKFRSAGRKLFLLTNSRWPYTDRMMTYLLGGSMPEYPTWRHFFDVVIVAAQKPAFFQQRRPLEERVGEELRRARSRPTTPRARTVRHSPTFRQNVCAPSAASNACEDCFAKSKKRVFSWSIGSTSGFTPTGARSSRRPAKNRVSATR